MTAHLFYVVIIYVTKVRSTQLNSCGSVTINGT